MIMSVSNWRCIFKSLPPLKAGYRETPLTFRLGSLGVPTGFSGRFPERSERPEPPAESDFSSLCTPPLLSQAYEMRNEIA
jgi:hypothetical protein